jgi:hypothetical protein
MSSTAAVIAVCFSEVLGVAGYSILATAFLKGTAARNAALCVCLRPLFGVVVALQSREVSILIIGYVAVIWGSSGLRQWIAASYVLCRDQR